MFGFYSFGHSNVEQLLKSWVRIRAVNEKATIFLPGGEILPVNLALRLVLVKVLDEELVECEHVVEARGRKGGDELLDPVLAPTCESSSDFRARNRRSKSFDSMLSQP